MIGTAHACAPSRDTSPEMTARHHESTSARDTIRCHTIFAAITRRLRASTPFVDPEQGH
jgi:hypothetical protein